MKNNKFLIRILATLLLSVAFLFLIISPYNRKNSNSEVASLGINDKVFSPITNEQILNSFNGETKVIYLGKIDKEYSKILESLYKASLTSQINNIYYSNIEKEKRVLSYNIDSNEIIIEKDGTDFYNKLLDKLGSFAEIYTLYNRFNEPINSGYKTIYTPMVIFIKDGKILFTYYTAKSDLNDNELKELYNIYKEGFKKIS